MRTQKFSHFAFLPSDSPSSSTATEYFCPISTKALRSNCLFLSRVAEVLIVKFFRHEISVKMELRSAFYRHSRLGGVSTDFLAATEHDGMRSLPPRPTRSIGGEPFEWIFTCVLQHSSEAVGFLFSADPVVHGQQQIERKNVTAAA